MALDAAVDNAKDAIQVLGGIGFTWEHDAHLYLRRALALGSCSAAAALAGARGQTRARWPARRRRPRGKAKIEMLSREKATLGAR